MTQRLWTPEEFQRLLSGLSSGLSIMDAAKAVGRSYGSAASVLYKAGINTRQLQASNTYGVIELAALFSVSETVIRKWMRRGLLASHRATEPSGKRWKKALYTRIYRDQVKAFLRNRMAWMEWAPAQIIDPDLRALATDIRLHTHGDWLTTREVAARYGYAHSAGYHWCAAGLIPSVVSSDRYYVWSGDLVDFVPPLDAYTTERRRIAALKGKL